MALSPITRLNARLDAIFFAMIPLRGEALKRTLDAVNDPFIKGIYTKGGTRRMLKGPLRVSDSKSKTKLINQAQRIKNKVLERITEGADQSRAKWEHHTGRYRAADAVHDYFGIRSN